MGNEKTKDSGFWVFVKWKPGAPRDAWKAWNREGWKWAWSCTGNWDCLMWISNADPNFAEKTVWDTVRSNEWVADTQTCWAWQWA